MIYPERYMNIDDLINEFEMNDNETDYNNTGFNEEVAIIDINDEFPLQAQ